MVAFQIIYSFETSGWGSLFNLMAAFQGLGISSPVCGLHGSYFLSHVHSLFPINPFVLYLLSSDFSLFPPPTSN